jgi:glutamate/tyrosine decarboxylase-like PLP-dependent enzyme
MLFNRSISLESGEYQIDGTSINLTYSGFVELRIDGYSVMFKQSLAQANYTRKLINTQYKHH